MTFPGTGCRPCADCGETKPVEGRGLCTRCYDWHHHRGTLERYPRRCIPAAHIVEDYEFLARYEGYTRAQAAERMGISKKRLEKAIQRENHRRLQEAS